MNLTSVETFSILGMGRSGVAAATLLANRGKTVIATDTRTDLQLEIPGVQLRTGGHNVEGSQVAIASPGIPPRADVMKTIDIPVVSEIELAFQFSACPYIGITGTDGKTTTTELIAHILTSAGVKTIAAGNIGTPLSEVVDLELDLVVAEVSAFQLWSIDQFVCAISVFTNIAEDHVDYFEDFETYANAKRALVKNATDKEIGVFNVSDAYCSSWAAAFPGTTFAYGKTEPTLGEHRMWIADGWVMWNGDRFMACGEIPLVGVHNTMNVMAASLAAIGWGVGRDAIVDAVASFSPAPHRLQPLGVVAGCMWYDDSKATNAHASIAGLENIEPGFVVIAGGVDKGLDLNPLAEVITRRAKAAVLIGDVRDRLSAALSNADDEFSVVFEASMTEAVKRALILAGQDGTVVLSPACSSFDMFESYADRGRQFQAAVRALGES